MPYFLRKLYLIARINGSKFAFEISHSFNRVGSHFDPAPPEDTTGIFRRVHASNRSTFVSQLSMQSTTYDGVTFPRSFFHSPNTSSSFFFSHIALHTSISASGKIFVKC